MSDIIVPKKILFVTKYNSCRGPAAEGILKSIRPDFTVFSVGSSKECIGMALDPVMFQHLEYIGCNPETQRQAMYVEWVLDEIKDFEIHDLDKERVKHPYDNGFDYSKVLEEITTYISSIILELDNEV